MNKAGVQIGRYSVRRADSTVLYQAALELEVYFLRGFWGSTHA